MHVGCPLSRSLCESRPEGALGRGTAEHGEGLHIVQVPVGQPGARLSAPLFSKAHPRPCQPAVDVEQVPKECPRHQEDPGRQPAAALQGALCVPNGGEWGGLWALLPSTQVRRLHKPGAGAQKRVL